VVLASGGFQHDAGLVAAHLPGVPVAAMGTPACDGDGLRLALAAGAAVGQHDEGWWMPALACPGEELDGAPTTGRLHAERAYPGSIMVDGRGRRFVNEAQNYGDVGGAMGRGGRPVSGSSSTPPVGGAIRSGPVGPGDPDPAWLERADDLDALAVSSAWRPRP
jgi:3-oxosteroid 1-dehydrogenase